MGASSPTTENTATAVARIAWVLVLALALGAVGWHVNAESRFRASRATGIGLETRFARAYSAAALEPFNRRYAARRLYVTAWLRADTLLAAGDYKGAVNLLSNTVGHTLAEPDLLALYREAQRVQTAETNRKAHLQHAHEGPGGTLKPTDVER